MNLFGNRTVYEKWTTLGDIGKKWQLISFNESKPPTWESFWKKERVYWNADDNEKGRVQLFFGDENTEASLLCHSKKRYLKYVNHLKKWNGLCELEQILEVILLDQYELVLTTNWQGQIQDHSDLLIMLLRERTFFGKHVTFRNEIYSFGTIPSKNGAIENGQNASINLGLFDETPTSVKRMDEYIKINDATFRII